MSFRGQFTQVLSEGVMRKGLSVCILIGATTALSGCMDAPLMSKLSDVKPVAFVRDQMAAPAPMVTGAPQLAAANSDSGSEIISGLISRRSVLDAGSPYDTLASTLLETSSGVAQAELRAAKMRSVSRDKNWLPTIGPSISLTSLGEFAAGLLVNQVLYDNGKKKAEREFAAADVEVAAVVLAQDENDRVHSGLELLVVAAEAREKTAMAQSGLGRMREFNRVVGERVRGGLSSLADERVVHSKISEMEHEAATHSEARDSAISELRSMMSGHSVPELSAPSGIKLASSSLETLDVVRARAEAKRASAEAHVERASLLPTLSATGLIGKNSSAALDYEGSGLGLGTRAEMEASKAREGAALALVGRAQETAARQRSRLDSSLQALSRKERDAADLVQQSRANYRLFQDQFEAGKKTVMDVLSVYEQMVRDELKHIDVKYEIVQTQLEAARLAGVLANGAEI